MMISLSFLYVYRFDHIINHSEYNSNFEIISNKQLVDYTKNKQK